jgi:hypothetical protein
MKKTARICAVLATAILAAAPVLADDPHVTAAGPRPLGVWDHAGNFVGDLFATRALVRAYNGQSASFTFIYLGFPQPQGGFLYTTADCSGQAYLDVLDQPAGGAIIDGVEFYPTSAGSQLQIQSEGLPGVSCSPNKIEDYAAPVQSRTLPTFTPPFCVSAGKVKC